MTRLITLTLSLWMLPGFASAETINACAKKKTGHLRLVADPDQCRRNEVPLSWNSEGPQGPPGPTQTVFGIFDGDGDLIGPAVGDSFTIPLAYSEELDLVIPILSANGTLLSAEVAFTDPNCQGQGYVSDLRFAGALVGPFLNDRFWGVRTELESGVIAIRSVMRIPPNTPCANEQTTLDFGLPADEITEALPFTIPFPLPIHVAPVAP